MLKARIIPCLDVKDGRVVKGQQFTDIVDVDDPEVLAEYYSGAGADELVFYDITATGEGRKISFDFITKVAEKTTIPFAVGGGIANLDDIAVILDKGAQKISINSAAVRNPHLLTTAATKFGSQAITLAIDAKQMKQGKWHVFINGGKEDTGIDVIEWAVRGVKLGAGELVINSIDQDGMKDGYDLELLRAITSRVDVPVIASGGAGKMEHFSQAILQGGAAGVLAASVFHYKVIEIGALREHLQTMGIGMK